MATESSITTTITSTNVAMDGAERTGLTPMPRKPLQRGQELLRQRGESRRIGMKLVRPAVGDARLPQERSSGVDEHEVVPPSPASALTIA